MIKGHVQLDDDKGILTGWALESVSKSSVNICIEQNSQTIYSCPGIVYRRDLVDHDKGLHGNYGFKINIDLLDLDHDTPFQIYGIFNNKTKTILHESPFTLQFSHDKILVIGLPKSGTSYLATIVHSSYENSKIHFEPGGNRGLCDIPLHLKLVSEKKNIISKSLLVDFPNTKLRDITKLYSKIIVIIRDPRDNFISHFFYRWYYLHKIDRSQFNRSYEKMKMKEANPNSISMFDVIGSSINLSNYLDKTYSFLKEVISKLEGENKHIILYSDLMQNKTEPLEKYLGVRLEKNVTVHKSIKRVARSRSYNNWKKYFTEEDIRLSKLQFQPYLDYFGFSEDWELDDITYLDPQQGSEYMYNLFHGLI